MHESNFSEAENELLTIRDFLRWGTSHFNEAELHFGHGTDNAWDEALHLILYALSLPADVDQTILDARLTSSERKLITKLFKKRIVEKIPTPYLTTTAYFAGLEFYVDDRVLIPRSPFAELIRNRFEPWIDVHQVKRMLEIGTGSGCIATFAATMFPEAEIIATDVSEDALEIAELNITDYNVEEIVTLVQSDVFENISGQFDVIVSNPPYVGKEEYDGLPDEYRHEPKAALLAGKDGLSIVKRILKEAKEYLTPHGILIVEVGNTQEVLEAAYPDVPFTWLEFEKGGEGVFLLTAEQLHHLHEKF